MKNGYEQTYELLVPRLATHDFALAALHLGLAPPVEDSLEVTFLRRRYRVDHQGVFEADGEPPSHINCRSVLIYYVTWGGKGEPYQRYQQLHQFSGGIFTGGGSKERGADWMLSPLTEQFNGKPELFEATMEVMGAKRCPASASGVTTWHYLVLPKMPIEIRYYEKDDEFDCEVHILFDQTATQFTPFETLCVLHGCLVSEIVQVGRETQKSEC
ncbi:MAG: DUF3786 domain-containing protein [Coriobacteriales bacterium]|nr:DUF3786 domain-containing protein [Coriobacteriales bacterium]